MRSLFLLLLMITGSIPLAAQEWNGPQVMNLVRRAIERRENANADTTLRNYRATAHGFVFFLAQVGEGLNDPPRLVKADELDLEVYWQAPNQSKQVILGWRDGRWLPTDINYHRDHLGIVTNNFGDRIRIGEGDEVRDVIHPLSPAGPVLYDYALRDSTRLQSGSTDLRVYEIAVRPQDFSDPLVVGTMYISVDQADLVRFRFSFTPASYLDDQLEDITIVLENGLWENRYWLPYRQEIEIRRRTTWLDFPARGVIRGRWEIGDYSFNLDLPPGIFRGPAIAGLREANNDDPRWTVPLAEAVADEAAPVNRQDLEDVRVEVERIAGARALGGIAGQRLAAGSLSDIARVNRVQGLALGAGATFTLPGSPIELQPYLSFGTSDHRVTGRLSLSMDAGSILLRATGERVIEDFSDEPVIAPVLNSFSAQEFGRDYGDYVLRETAALSARRRLSGRSTLTAEIGYERTFSPGVSATPSRGTYRPNPPLGAAPVSFARLTLEHSGGGFALERDLEGAVQVEAGTGNAGGYVRATVDGIVRIPLAGGSLESRLSAGWGSAELPAYKSFVMGGRGTLVGEDYREWGGRSSILAHLEWRHQVPFVAIPLGGYASTGQTAIIAPFLAAGWTDREYPELPWREAEGVRPVAGVALELFLQLIRLEAGVGLRTGDVGVTVDINRAWWELL